MELVFFIHGDFLPSRSMPKFAKMLTDGMKERGHSVTVWTPVAKFAKLSSAPFIKKWLGYIDQYLVFPSQVKKQIKLCRPKTLFVFTDNALGPWVPLVADRPHVIHCHDFLAQRSAKNEIPENKTSATGKIYQDYLRRGYSKGKNFISVSEKTKADLHRLLGFVPFFSRVVYNGLNQSFAARYDKSSLPALSQKTGVDLTAGYILHVGGNQWYKNRIGVVEIYNSWRALSGLNYPLLLIGNPPSESLKQAYDLSPWKKDIFFITDASDELVRIAYANASVFLFPSLAEGFGWPIAEAMASGCLTITTNEAPMTEVAGEAGFLIDRRPYDAAKPDTWKTTSAQMLDKVLHLPEDEKKRAIEKGFANAARFNTGEALDAIENIYEEILLASRS